MANAFKSYTNTTITTEVTILTGPVATEATAIGLTVANTSGLSTTASITLNGAYLVKDAPIPVGGSLVAIGGEQKVVIEAGDLLRVSATETVDTILSTLEIS